MRKNDALKGLGILLGEGYFGSLNHHLKKEFSAKDANNLHQLISRLNLFSLDKLPTVIEAMIMRVEVRTGKKIMTPLRKKSRALRSLVRK